MLCWSLSAIKNLVLYHLLLCLLDKILYLEVSIKYVKFQWECFMHDIKI